MTRRSRRPMPATGFTTIIVASVASVAFLSGDLFTSSKALGREKPTSVKAARSAFSIEARRTHPPRSTDVPSCIYRFSQEPDGNDRRTSPTRSSKRRGAPDERSELAFLAESFMPGEPAALTATLGQPEHRQRRLRRRRANPGRRKPFAPCVSACRSRQKTGRICWDASRRCSSNSYPNPRALPSNSSEEEPGRSWTTTVLPHHVLGMPSRTRPKASRRSTHGPGLR